MRFRHPRALALVAAALAAALLLAACGGERERLSQELTEQLAAVGVEAFDVSVWPPHGMVPHTNVELRVEGDEATARAACAAVEQLAVYGGELPYLVRVTYDAGRVFECGWGKEELRPSGASPASRTREPAPSTPRDASTPAPSS